MGMLTVKTLSPGETIDTGETLGALLMPGDIIFLQGGLGAGKTHFAKGVARGLGIEEPVTSPTFTLINEYYGRLPLYHFDAYRLCSEEELDDLGVDEYFYGDGVSLIEWPEKLGDYSPREYLEVNIIISGEDCREINFAAYGKRYGELLAELRQRVSA